MRTPLHFAAAHGKLDCLLILLRSGATLTAKDELGYTVLHHAASISDIRMIAYLIKEGCNVEEPGT